MKVLATSDLHGHLEGLDFSGQDLVIIAGDFARMYGWGKWHLNDMKKWILKKFIPLTQNDRKILFVVVPGNHDLVFDNSKTGIYPEMDYSIEWPDNVHLLIDREISVNGYRIYGTPAIPIINYRWAFEMDSEKLAERFSRIPSDLDILITHSPPHVPNSYVDYSIQTQNGPFGSHELARAISEKLPRYVFCGHIHSGSHDPCYFGKSLIYNVARVDEDYDVSYEPTKIEIFK